MNCASYKMGAPHFAFRFRAWVKTAFPIGGFVRREPVEWPPYDSFFWGGGGG